MPGRKTNLVPHEERRQLAEDLMARVQEAAGEAGMIAASLEEHNNPPAIVGAWRDISSELEALFARAEKLAR